MSITQVVLKNNLQQEDLASLLLYDLDRHMFIPTKDLIAKGGINFGEETVSNDEATAEYMYMAETLYGFMGLNMPNANMEIVLARLAENEFNEQTTIARAFIALAPFWVYGGDKANYDSGIRYDKGQVIPANVIANSQIGLLTKQILRNGTGQAGSGIWFEGRFDYEVDEVTDLVFGTDY